MDDLKLYNVIEIILLLIKKIFIDKWISRIFLDLIQKKIGMIVSSLCSALYFDAWETLVSVE